MTEVVVVEAASLHRKDDDGRAVNWATLPNSSSAVRRLRRETVELEAASHCSVGDDGCAVCKDFCPMVRSPICGREDRDQRERGVVHQERLAPQVGDIT